MNAPAKPFVIEFHGGASLGSVLAAMARHESKALVIDYGGRTIRRGYHVTEVKAGSFVTLDCGGNPDAWRETILQVEDMAAEGEQAFMAVGKFEGILDPVGERIAIDPDARLTFEVGIPAVPMQVFDVDAVQIQDDRIVLQLGARPAICKPRHRAAQAAEATPCCGAKAPRDEACCE